MSKEQIFINDIELELPSKTSIALTSQINDLSDLKDHQSNYSNNVKAPLTPRNIAAIENSEQVQSESLIPYRKNRARINKLGADVLKDGFAVLTDTQKEINLAIYEGNVDFFSAIDGKSIKDLDLSDLSHVFDYAGVTDSFTNDYTDGFKYSLIDYGKMSATTRYVAIQDMKATVFVAYIFTKILEEAGFTYEGAIFSDDIFNRLLITTENDNVGTYFDNNDLIETGETVLYTYPDTEDATDFNSTIKLAANNYYQYSMTITFTISGWVNGSSYFYVKLVVPHQAVGDTLFTHSDADGNGTFTKTFLFNTLSYSNVRDYIVGIAEAHGLCTLTMVSGELAGSIVGATDSIFKVAILPIAARTASTTDSYNANFGFDLDNQYGFTTVDIAQIIPDISQKDFIKSIGSLFHLMFKTNQYEKKIYLKQFKEIVADIPNALDWTLKVDMASFKSNLSFKVDGYASNNLCKYTEDDNDTKPKGLGNGTITVDDETLQKEKTVIQLPYSSTLMATRLVAYSVPIIKRVDDNGDYTIENVPRLLIDDTGSTWDTSDITIDDGLSGHGLLKINSGIPFCYFMLGEKEFNLGFNNSILKDNYSALTQVLNKSKRLLVWMKLSALDFYNLDHFKPIYLAQYSAYFYINKVVNWTGEGLTKVELIRIGIRNQGLLGIIQRCTSDGLADGYGQMNRIWDAGMHTYILRKMTINGVQYASNQTLIINAPGDLVVGIGLNGDNFIMNVSDWLNTILPIDFVMHDNCLVFDYPVDSTFLIEIEYIDDASGFNSSFTYQYRNTGFYIDGSLYITYTCELL